MDTGMPRQELESSQVIADINITPFIDIMLVLLIIFMVAAPLMMGGIHVNLPKSNGAPMQRPENPVIVSLDAECRIFVDKEEVRAEGRHEFFQELARGSDTGEVYVRGDGEVKYARMMELMSELGQAGFSRVTLVTQITGTSSPEPDQSPRESADAPVTGAHLSSSSGHGGKR